MPEGDIFVTQPYLPPLSELIPSLEQIWENRILTNGGPFHRDFEAALCEYLGVDYISVFTNATVALMTALQAIGASGEVITTPYSFVATTNSILWNGLTPVFADVDPVTLNLDPREVEAAISPATSAILAVHCYGHPCDVEGIAEVAAAHGLPVIYDAAHAFGVRDEGGSVLRHGDLSVLSFHATKVFNTFEGGAIISHSAEMKARIDKLKNFGHDGEIHVVAPGINGKMSEFGAALGLVQLKHADEVIALRGTIDARYRAGLAGVRGITCLDPSTETESNFAYFPILVDDDFPMGRDELVEYLKDRGIHPRRYFYPLISTFPMYSQLPSAEPSSLPAAHSAAEHIICLPIYPDLAVRDVDRIISAIAEV